MNATPRTPTEPTTRVSRQPSTAIARNHLLDGEFAQAEPLWLRSEQIRRANLGPDHPALAFPIQGLANLYLETEQFEEAVTWHEEAIRIMDGANIPDVAHFLEGLGEALTNLGREAEAEEALERARELRAHEEQDEPDEQ